MDARHADCSNHLLQRKCSCGNEGEMLVDFVADFFVRCKACHLHTHAYITPDAAAMHWNRGDDIMDKPAHIFLDDPMDVLSGEIIAIRIHEEDLIEQSLAENRFYEAVLEYPNKQYLICNMHDFNGPVDALDFCELIPKAADKNHCLFWPENGGSGRVADLISVENDIFKELLLHWDGDLLSIRPEGDHLLMTRR